jgi:hypothetical protein
MALAVARRFPKRASAKRRRDTDGKDSYPKTDCFFKKNRIILIDPIHKKNTMHTHKGTTYLTASEGKKLGEKHILKEAEILRQDLKKAKKENSKEYA